MKIAVVGSGIAGLVAARILSTEHELTVFESSPSPGGNARTCEVTDHGQTTAFDVGVSMFYEKAYPNFFKLMSKLGIAFEPVDLSFEVNPPDSLKQRDTLYVCTGSPFDRLISAKRTGLLRLKPQLDLFFKTADACPVHETLRTTLGKNHFTAGFRSLFSTLCAATWTLEFENILEFPTKFAAGEIRKFDFPFATSSRPWLRAADGVRQYVEALSKPLSDLRLNTVVNKVERTETGIFVHSSYGTEEFDRLVFAVPGEIALQLLSNPLALEEKTLANFRSGSQKLFLTSHWPSSSRRVHDASVRVELEENIGRQEKLRIAIADLPQFARKKTQTPYYLALVGNEREFTFPQDRIADWACHTPVITPAVIEAQTQHNKISGHDRIYYCGACWGNGLHEAGVASALQVTKSFGLGVDAI